MYAGFDAPALREILQQQLPEVVAPEALPVEEITLTYQGSVGPILTARCGACHATNGIQGLDVTTYEALLRGGTNGPALVPGDPDGSLLLQKQTAGIPHFGQLDQDELQWVIDWIAAGAPEG
ncbi:MAG: hypothetical protein GTO63_11690 [Anaerolineae bacterium]|nr:hypothetical protein [Anaerolineae bacterium]NIN95527.1 hypothetical protein [Anaerolineae bacterium]